MKKAIFFLFLLSRTMVYSEAVENRQPVFFLTPMIGTTLDVYAGGLEKAYANITLSASLASLPWLTLQGSLIAAADAFHFRIPVLLTLGSDRLPGIQMLVGCGPGSWDHDGWRLCPVLTTGCSATYAGWCLSATICVAIGADFSDTVIDVAVGRLFAF